jgi:hypothetical protein
MFKTAVVKFLVVTACFAQLVAGSNCQPGLCYCGFALLKIGTYPFSHMPSINAKLPIGNYLDQINTALRAHYLTPNDEFTVQNTLFHCIGGPQGDIDVTSFCTYGCVAGGSGINDFCRAQGQAANITASVTGLPRSSSTISTVIHPGTSPTDPPTAGNNDNGSSVGRIVGGVVGGVLGLALIGALIFFFFRKKRHLHKINNPVGQEKDSRTYGSRHVGFQPWPVENGRPVAEVPACSEPRIYEAPTEMRQELY